MKLKEIVSLTSELKFAEDVIAKPPVELTVEEIKGLKAIAIKLYCVIEFFTSYYEAIKRQLLFNPNSSANKEVYIDYDFGKKLTYAAQPKLSDTIDLRAVYLSIKHDEDLEEQFWGALNIVKNRIYSPTLLKAVQDNTTPGEAGAPYGVIKMLNLSKQDLVDKLSSVPEEE